MNSHGHSNMSASAKPRLAGTDDHPQSFTLPDALLYCTLWTQLGSKREGGAVLRRIGPCFIVYMVIFSLIGLPTLSLAAHVCSWYCMSHLRAYYLITTLASATTVTSSSDAQRRVWVNPSLRLPFGILSRDSYQRRGFAGNPLLDSRHNGSLGLQMAQVLYQSICER
jgi:hypothetical protein